MVQQMLDRTSSSWPRMEGLVLPVLLLVAGISVASVGCAPESAPIGPTSLPAADRSPAGASGDALGQGLDRGWTGVAASTSTTDIRSAGGVDLGAFATSWRARRCRSDSDCASGEVCNGRRCEVPPPPPPPTCREHTVCSQRCIEWEKKRDQVCEDHESSGKWCRNDPEPTCVDWEDYDCRSITICR